MRNIFLFGDCCFVTAILEEEYKMLFIDLDLSDDENQTARIHP
ncbi:MAG: hypothetical protein PUG48_00475 [Clostridia bacterium]|nr:hypothetical protein [Clostridia bacterium]